MEIHVDLMELALQCLPTTFHTPATAGTVTQDRSVKQVPRCIPFIPPIDQRKIICWLRLISLLNLHSYALGSFQVRVYQIHVPLDILALIRQRRSMATIIDAQVFSTELFVLCPFLTLAIIVVSSLPRGYCLEHTVHKVQKVLEALLLQQYCYR